MSRIGSGDRKTKPVYRKPQERAEFWEGKIDRLSWGGLGVAHHEDGRILLLSAPLALFPGERVRARVRWKARHGEGEVVEWLEGDSRRADPGCPVAARCGGCQLRGAGPQGRELKRQMVEDLLRRQLPGGPEWTWVPAPPETRRHRIQLHWDGKALGYHAPRSHDLVPVTHCPAAVDALNRAMAQLQTALAKRTLMSAARWELVTGTPEGEVWAVGAGHTWKLKDGAWSRDNGPILHAFRGASLGHRPGGFFQVCPTWALDSFHTVLEGWDLKGETLFDLYGGVGLFSVMLAERFSNRVLVEFDAAATELARVNLEAAGLQATCIAESVDTWLPEQLGAPGDLILADPPRSGLSEVVRQGLLEARASELVLIGCDGAAFCRDVRALAPTWRLEDLHVLDLFPDTPHVECVGRFIRI